LTFLLKTTSSIVLKKIFSLLFFDNLFQWTITIVSLFLIPILFKDSVTFSSCYERIIWIEMVNMKMCFNFSSNSHRSFFFHKYKLWLIVIKLFFLSTMSFSSFLFLLTTKNKQQTNHNLNPLLIVEHTQHCSTHKTSIWDIIKPFFLFFAYK
jgi:hypothetical protein